MDCKMSNCYNWKDSFVFVKDDIDFYDVDNHKMNPEDVFTDLDNVFSFICKSERAIEYFEMWHFESDFFEWFEHPVVNHIYTFVRLDDLNSKKRFWIDATDMYPRLKKLHKDIHI